MKAPWRRGAGAPDGVLDQLARLRADPDAPLQDDAPPELASLHRDLRADVWRRARVAALGATIRRASHDMRGLLSPGLMAAERLQNHADPAVSRTGALLTANIDRMTELLRATMDYAEEARAPLALSRFPLRAMVEEAAAQSLAPSQTLALRLAIDADLEIEADRDALTRVFVNLARNAAAAGAASLRIGATTEMGMMRIEVADDGRGVPEALRQTLFEPFTAEPSDRQGLGLAIARDLLVAGGGSIALASTGPAGTVFHITLVARDRPPPRPA
jgi:signal transduction histidine kinase